MTSDAVRTLTASEVIAKVHAIPQAGDEVQGKTGTIRKVLQVWRHSNGKTFVNFLPRRNGVEYRNRNVELAEWRRWCANNVNS